LRPLIVAHRGAMAEAPENTKPAFDKAISYAMDGIEFDVQLTADDCPVVFHDSHLEKITRPKQSISDLSLHELSAYDWGKWFSPDYAGLKILTLDDVLKNYSARTRLLIEIKSSPDRQARDRNLRLASMVVEAVRNLVPNQLISEMFILSFDPEIIKSAFMNDPYLNYVLNLEVPVTDASRLNIDPDILCGYCIEQRLLSREFIEDIHDDDRIIMAYSCNDEATLRHLLKLDLDVIMTDDPGHSIWKQFD